MASLMEELINVLKEEHEVYKKLLELSLKKTPVIIGANLEELAKITDDEQLVVSELSKVDKKRDMFMRDIANVINKDVNTLKLSDLITMLEARPQEQKQLADIYDKLKATLYQMRQTNEQNKALIESSLEMVQFDMNILQSMKAAPQTANYNRGAYSSGSSIGMSSGGFDSKS